MPADQKAVVFQGSGAQGLKGPAELLGCTGSHQESEGAEQRADSFEVTHT